MGTRSFASTFLGLGVLIVGLLLSGSAAAEYQGAHKSAVAAAQQTLDRFMVAFNRRDMSAWAQTLNYPHVRFASGGVTVWATVAEFVAREPFAQLQATGWDHSHWQARDVVLASPAKVHLATKFQRYNAANEVIGTYESLYIVTKVNGAWGIQARSSLAP